MALELAGQPPLIAVESGQWVGVESREWGVERQDRPLSPLPTPRSPLSTPHRIFRLPALSGSWGLCAEGLRHPHTGEVRPIVFDHALLAEAREDVVLVHLNHRLVQMSLRLCGPKSGRARGRRT